ncbi:DNA polymerase III subunit beta [Patescibacteria group bacterium]|nr:DNA polymerase III subunit beta [Patescibacteria group bacterium]
MKLTCLQENLNSGLQTTGHLVNKNVNLPILNNVLLEAKDGTLKLSSTNLEIGISATVRCKVETEGAFTVDAKLLADYVNLLPNDQINIEKDADDSLKLTCRSSSTKIKGIASDDFPVIPQLEKEKPYKVNIKDFKKALSQVIFSVAVSETRPEISGVLMTFNKFEANSLYLAGTDSYRLAEKKIAVAENTEEKEVIVPVKALQEVLRILNGLKDQMNAPESIDLFISDNQILFSGEGFELISRLIEGQYPDYKQIIPKETKTTVTVSTSDLTKVIKTVALFSKTGIFDVNLVFDPGRGLVIRAANIQVGESTSEIDVEFVGTNNESTINYRYLLEGLSNIDASEIKISLVDGNIPLLINPKDNDDYLYIIMPIRQ